MSAGPRQAEPHIKVLDVAVYFMAWHVNLIRFAFRNTTSSCWLLVEPKSSSVRQWHSRMQDKVVCFVLHITTP